jgi:hypothetical protein
MLWANISSGNIPASFMPNRFLIWLAFTSKNMSDLILVSRPANVGAEYDWGKHDGKARDIWTGYACGHVWASHWSNVGAHRHERN